MNEEEKKAVEKIKEIIECFYCFPNPTSIELKDCDCSTLEIALNLIEKLQKENEELKEIYRSEKKMKNEYIKLYQDLLLKENVIPVQKVKDKISEILNNGEYRIIFEGDTEFPDEATIINAQRYIKLEKLQELLEERKLEED